MRVKVIIHDGIVVDVLATAQVELEVVDIDRDYEDCDALLRYEEELRQDPELQSRDYTVAHFDTSVQMCVCLQKEMTRG